MGNTCARSALVCTAQLSFPSAQCSEPQGITCVLAALVCTAHHRSPLLSVHSHRGTHVLALLLLVPSGGEREEPVANPKIDQGAAFLLPPPPSFLLLSLLPHSFSSKKEGG